MLSDFFKKYLTADLIKKYIGSLIRGLLYTIAGSLAAVGVMFTDDASKDLWVNANLEVVSGIAIYIFTQVLSFAEKAKKD